MNTIETVVVTRHPALIQHLVETGVIVAGATVIENASPEQVRGKKVVGVLPIHLAALTAEYINVGLFTPADLRGKELNIEQVRQYAQPAAAYKIVAL